LLVVTVVSVLPFGAFATRFPEAASTSIIRSLLQEPRRPPCRIGLTCLGWYVRVMTDFFDPALNLSSHCLAQGKRIKLVSFPSGLVLCVGAFASIVFDFARELL
jgi:hypothetical protein